MGWFSILDNKVTDTKALTTKRRKSLGCTGCPLNSPDIKKIKNLREIAGKKAMLWVQSTGLQQTITGPGGRFLTRELNRAGFDLDDFDIQSVLRCHTNGEPDSKELQHCSVFNDEAVERNGGKAHLYIVVGKIAQKQFLGSECYLDRPVFWSERLHAHVVMLDSPDYFLHGAPGWRLDQFRKRLKAAQFFYKNPDRWHFLKKTCDLRLLKTHAEEKEFFRDLFALAGSPTRVSLDIEEGLVNGKRKVLMIAASWKKHQSRCLALEHPQADQTHLKWKLDRLREFLDDPKIKKVFQYGPSDTESIRRLLGMRVRGYDFDTTYAHYFIYTFLRSHSLATIASEGYPLFSNYKEMVDVTNLAGEPLWKVALYNNADACLTKLAELDFSKFPEVSYALMQTYIWAGIQLHRMETRGPLLDRVELARIRTFLPKMLKDTLQELRMLAGNPEFNPNTPADVAKVMYERLQLPLPEGEKEGATGIEVLEAIIKQTNHPFPKLIKAFRRLGKMDSTYMENYETSANKYDGELRTNWFLTGAVTGRLRSGGGEKGSGKINMQNLHGDPLLQNLIVSDVNWRAALEHIQ